MYLCGQWLGAENRSDIIETPTGSSYITLVLLTEVVASLMGLHSDLGTSCKTQSLLLKCVR